MKKLYRVDITIMVMAEDEIEAANIAVHDAVLEEQDCETYEATSVPSEWYDAIPWGRENNLTCGEILKRQRDCVAEL